MQAQVRRTGGRYSERAPGTERRRAGRHATQWAAHASGQGTHLIGSTVWDVSRTGLFLAPPDGESLPNVGSSLRISVFPFGDGSGIDAMGIVRWAGESPQHGCPGLGIEFEQAESGQRLIRRLQLA
jgi:hypothetical protein